MNQSTKITLIGCDTIANSPSILYSHWTCVVWNSSTTQEIFSYIQPTVPAELTIMLFWFPKLPHSEAKEQAIYNVLLGSSKMHNLLEKNGYNMYLLAEISECLHTKAQLRKSDDLTCLILKVSTEPNLTIFDSTHVDIPPAPRITEIYMTRLQTISIDPKELPRPPSCPTLCLS